VVDDDAADVEAEDEKILPMRGTALHNPVNPSPLPSRPRLLVDAVSFVGGGNCVEDDTVFLNGFRRRGLPGNPPDGVDVFLTSLDPDALPLFPLLGV